MLKKFAALLLSLLLCLALLPGQALATDEPAPAEPAAVEEPVDPKEPEEPPVMPLSEVLDGKDTDHAGGD